MGNAMALLWGLLLVSVTIKQANGQFKQDVNATSFPWERLADWSYAGYRGNEREIPSGTPNSKLFNVRDFGALGDGINDDTASIRAAVQAAVDGQGGIIFMPAGIYNLTARIDLNASNLILRGEGVDRTILRPAIPLLTVDNETIYDLYTSPYTWWDGFVRIYGPVSITSDSSHRNTTMETYIGGDEILAQITAPASAGSKLFNVSSTQRIVPGDFVRVFMSETGSKELANALYTNDILSVCSSCLDGFKSKAADLVHFPSKVVFVGPGYIELERPLPWEVKLDWLPQIRAYLPGTPMDSGIENFSLELPHSLSQAHHKEQGYNGIYLANAAHCWVNNIKIINADVGVIVHNVDFTTVNNIFINLTASRVNPPYSAFDGHIGLGASFSNDVIFNNFTIAKKFTHDLTVRNTVNIVFNNGTGLDLSIDGHRWGPWATLFANINLGRGARPFQAGGSESRGLPFGSYTTFYNFKRINQNRLKVPLYTRKGYCTYGSKMNFIGPKFATPNVTCADYWSLNTYKLVLPANFTLPQKRTQANVTLP